MPWQQLLLAFLVFASSLLAWGVLIDQVDPLDQVVLWAGLQVASLTGALLGLAAMFPHAETKRQRWMFALAALVAWRLAYFPIMVFSGHVASIGEWLLLLGGAPVIVYPIFLVAVAAIHAAAAAAATLVVAPPHRAARLVLVPAFFVAACVSFLSWRDLGPLPDTAWSLDAPVPAPVTQGRNPYLPALTGPGYWPNQRVILLAAALTYDTIPPSPWATTVKHTLEKLFDELPHAATRDRVREHYQGYHSAHFRIGCRDLAACPAVPPATPPDAS